jgi:hypothetical protein
MSKSKVKKPSKTTRKESTQEVKKLSTQVSSDALPRRTIEEALTVAQLIRDNYAGKATTWTEIAKGFGISEKNPTNKYRLWAAAAYGLIIRQEDGTKFSLGEIGRKILAPTYEGEKEEGIKKALFTPSVLSRFYTDYNNSPVPSEDIFLNVLETRYDVPRERTPEAIEIIKNNARFAGALVQRPDGKEGFDFTDAPFQLDLTSATISDGFSEGMNRTNPIQDLGVVIDKQEDWEKVCFIITPIGSDDSLERKHADAVLRHLLEPVLAEFGFTAIRADKIAKPGLITKQIIEYIAYSRLCIADLSFNNPNAFYELGVRQAFKLSTIQIIRKGDKIPFDVSQGRTIIIDTSDPYTIMDRFDAARKELQEHVSNVVKGNEKQDDNPINIFLPNLKVSISK